MPWCSTCDRYLTPNAATADGACPTCGARLDDAGIAPQRASEQPTSPAEPEKIPWHFWLLVVALVLYLGWRLIQGVAWLL